MAARAGVEPTAVRLKVVSSKAPPRPPNGINGNQVMRLKTQTSEGTHHSEELTKSDHSSLHQDL